MSLKFTNLSQPRISHLVPKKSYEWLKFNQHECKKKRKSTKHKHLLKIVNVLLLKVTVKWIKCLTRTCNDGRNIVPANDFFRSFSVDELKTDRLRLLANHVRRSLSCVCVIQIIRKYFNLIYKCRPRYGYGVKV